jgi:hypothetical protein
MLGAVILAATVAWPASAVPFRVRIPRRALAAAVQDALAGASQRMKRAGCSAIFEDFTDRNGRTLQSNLDTLGGDGPAYLALIDFRDGLGIGRCDRGGIMAVTAPGSRVVWVCGGFALAQKRDPGLAEVVLLHEALHTLGLHEDPPSSLEITERVVKRCGR